MIIIDTKDFFELASKISESLSLKLDEDSLLILSEKLSDQIPAFVINELETFLELNDLDRLKQILSDNSIYI